jgi:serine/threonine protein kinase
MALNSRLGPYEVLALIGAGGMGDVYRARDSKLGRDVAIKVLPEAFAADPDRVARFEREARAIAALSHPNILAIFDFGTERGVAYAVTELLVGATLRDMVGRRVSTTLRHLAHEFTDVSPLSGRPPDAAC